MALQTKTTLKSFFETGDTPTESQFSDWIDTMASLLEANTYQASQTINFTSSADATAQGLYSNSIQNAVIGSGHGLFGMLSTSKYTASGSSAGGIVGVYSFAIQGGSGSLASMIGVQSAIYWDSSGSGNVTDVYGIKSDVIHTGSGIATNLYQFYASDIASGSGTFRYGFYQAGTNVTNVLESNLVVGGATLNASAIMQIVSTTKGFAPPRMTSAQRLAISTPITGLIVYDTSLESLLFWNGTTWIAAGAGGGGTGDISPGAKGQIGLYVADGETIGDSIVGTSGYSYSILVNHTNASRTTNIVYNVPDPGNGVSSVSFIVSDGGLQQIGSPMIFWGDVRFINDVIDSNQYSFFVGQDYSGTKGEVEVIWQMPATGTSRQYTMLNYAANSYFAVHDNSLSNTEVPVTNSNGILQGFSTFTFNGVQLLAPKVYVSTTTAADANSITGQFYHIQSGALGATKIGTAVYAQSALSFNGTVNELRANDAEIIINAGSSGVVTNAYVLKSKLTFLATANVTNAYGLHINFSKTSTGLAATGYGIYIDQLNDAATTAYAIYQSHASDMLHFAGLFDSDIRFTSGNKSIGANLTTEIITLGNATTTISMPGTVEIEELTIYQNVYFSASSSGVVELGTDTVFQDTAGNMFINGGNSSAKFQSLIIGSSLNTDAIVEFESTTKGLLIPRMNTTQRDAISVSTEGLMIYNTTTHAFNFYNGTSWAAVGSGGGGIVDTDNVNWTGVHTFTNSLGVTLKNYGASSGETTPLYFLDTGGTNKIGFKAPDSMAGDRVFVFPNDYPAVTGYALVCTDAGVFGWGNSGTVSSGTASRLALYDTTGTTVADTYIQNSQNIVVSIVNQSSRSAGLTYNIPNPGNAETAANFVLNKDSSGYVSILHNVALGDQTAAVSGYTPLDYNLQLGDTGTSARASGITLLGYQSANSVIGNLVFVNENLAISDKRGIVMEARRAGSNHIMNFYYNNGTNIVQVGAFGNGNWTFGNNSLNAVATVYIHNVSNQPNLRLAGTTVSSPAAGDLYYNSTKKHMCFGMAISLDASIVGQIYSATADSTAITANSETDFSLTKTLEANGFTAGKNIFIFAGGKLSTDASSAGTLIIKIKLGSTTIATGLTLTLPTSYSNVGWICEGVLTCRTTGASGTVVFDGKIIIDNDLYCAFTSAGTVTIDTTASQVLKLTNTFSVTGNSITMQTLALPTGN